MSINTNHQIDIIIPCLNESQYLPNTLKVLIELTNKAGLSVNIIVMDNGSTDNSCEIAKSFGVIVESKTCISIGSLRNHGVKRLNSDILVFLDADIEITQCWVSALSKFIFKTNKDKKIISGFPCQSPPKESYIEKLWFSNTVTNINYINSGNFITTRKLFNTIGGFDSQLTTGEDWDFCQRAKKAGGVVEPIRQFLVYHHGYPKTIGSFFLRELWHGCGDYESFNNFLQSKPALFSSFIGFLTIIWFIVVAYYPSIIFLLSLPSVLLFTGITFAFSRIRKLSFLPLNTFLSILYFYARSGSLLIVTWRKLRFKYAKSLWRWR